MSFLKELVWYAFTIYNYLILARVLLSWFPHNPRQPVIRFINEITEPVLAPFRRLMPRTAVPIDFSPILAFLVLDLVKSFVLRLL